MLQNLHRHHGLSAFPGQNHILSTALWLLSLLLMAPFAWAQSGYSSGSTGADGAFNPTADITVQLPESGVFNFTTVTIPVNVTVRFTRNSRNTPVTILATGNVVIAGTIDVSGSTNSYLLGGQGGPGGFDGGRGGVPGGNQQDGANGSGPGGGGGGRYINSASHSGGGGGFATAGQSGTYLNGGTGDAGGGGIGGAVYGVTTVVPMIGGSGGGGSSVYNSQGYSGGGGGGAILIASSGEISGSGVIYANGATSSAYGGSGSGGAIRLAANALKGSLSLHVIGGNNGHGPGGAGYVRLEAVNTTGFSPSIQPQNAAVSSAPPQPAIQANAPQLRIVSVAGVNAPNYLSGSFNGPDIILPSTQTGSVTVALAGTNVPLATQVRVAVVPQNGATTTVQASALTGTQASSTATASVTLPAGQSLIYATAVVDLTLISQLAPLYLDGERVRKVEISATFGSASDVVYITESGKRITRAGGFAAWGTMK